MSEQLHDRLVRLQTDDELKRKVLKAEGRHSRQFWIQETIDFAMRRAKRWRDAFSFDDAERRAKP